MSSKNNFIKEIYKLDRKLIGGTLRLALLQLKRKLFIYKIGKGLRNNGADVYYMKGDVSILNELCDRYGTDKGGNDDTSNPYDWPSHNYSDFYQLIFGLRRKDIRLVVECGIGTNNPGLSSSMGMEGTPGASLRVWKDYFQEAEIIGCDIDETILFKEDRINTFKCDQRSVESIRCFLRASGLTERSADIIIDDGLHEFSAGKTFFENVIQCLKIGGFYVIEDVSLGEMELYRTYFSSKLETLSVYFKYFRSNRNKSLSNNNLICIIRNC